MTPAEASRAGQRSLEHMDRVLESCIPGALERVKGFPAGDPDQAGLSANEWLAGSMSQYYKEAARMLFNESVLWPPVSKPAVCLMLRAWLTPLDLPPQ